MAGTSEGAKKAWDTRGRGRHTKARNSAADRGLAKMHALLKDPVYAQLHAASWKNALATVAAKTSGRTAYRTLGNRIASNKTSQVYVGVQHGHQGYQSGQARISRSDRNSIRRAYLPLVHKMGR